MAPKVVMMLMKTVARWTVILSVAVGLLAPWAAPAWAAKEARAQRFDVDVTAQADGSVLVTETLVFVYTGGPFTFVTREIDADLTDGLEFVAADMDGANLPLGDQPGQVEVSGDDPLRIKWHFAPTSDATHTFTLTYRALGVAQKTTEADVLRWQPIPDEHDYVIDSSTVTLHYPASARVLGTPTVEEAAAEVTAGEGSTVVTAQNLGEDDTLIVNLRFAPDSLTTATPAWQLRAERVAALTQQYAAPLIALALLIVFGGGLLAYVVWRRGQPDLIRDDAPVTAPPSALSPALAGALAAGQGEPGAPTALATLFDLAQRGVIAITQTEQKNWYGGMTPVFVVTLNERPAGLAAHEQQLLDEFFGANAAPGMTAPLTKKVTELINHWKRFAEPVKAALRQRGWWDEARQRQRVGWLFLSLLVIFVSIPLLILAAALRDTFGNFIFLLPLAGFVLGLVLLILASRISPYSDTGRVEAARWQRFTDYLNAVVGKKEAVTRPDLFEQYLAYATALGLAQGWVRFFEKRGEAAVPLWFQPLARDGQAGFGALIAVISTSGGTAGAGAAGAGAAGGGASGTG